MEFFKAVTLAYRNSHLIGKKFNGQIISELIVYPTDSIQFKEFQKSYLKHLNAQKAIIPFTNEDVHVGIVLDKERIHITRFFSLTEIENVPKELNPILE